MKNNILIFLIALSIGLSACQDEDFRSGGEDNILEFAHMSEVSLLMNEGANSVDGNELHVHAQLLIFNPRTEDVTLTVNVEGVNATEGTDFEVVGAKQIVISAGEYESVNGLMLKTIDNGIQNGDRSVVVTLTASSDANIILGKGLDDPPALLTTTIQIIDDECSTQMDIFDGAIYDVQAYDDYYGGNFDASLSTSMNGDVMTTSGDIINWDLGIEMEVRLVPETPGATQGTLEFVSSTIGQPGDGYDYRQYLTAGSYDVCAKTLHMEIAVQYGGGDSWTTYYNSTIDAEVGACQDDYTVFDVSSMAADVYVSSHYYGAGNSTEGQTFNVTATSSLNGTQITLTGLLTDWDNQEVEITGTFVPGSELNTGDFTFETEDPIVFPDGWTYRIQPPESPIGQYDACTKEITLHYELWYEDSGTWYWWTSFETTFKVN